MSSKPMKTNVPSSKHNESETTDTNLAETLEKKYAFLNTAPIFRMSRVHHLTDDNYGDWTFYARQMLGSFATLTHTLWDFINPDKDENSPPAPISPEEKQYHRRIQRLAYSAIGLSVTSPQISLIRPYEEAGDATGAWVALMKHHQAIGQCRSIPLKMSIFMAKMEEGASMKDHLNNMEDMRRRLESMTIGREQICDGAFASCICRSLPDSYKPFLKNFYLHSEGDKLDLFKLKEKLLANDEYRKMV